MPRRGRDLCLHNLIWRAPAVDSFHPSLSPLGIGSGIGRHQTEYSMSLPLGSGVGEVVDCPASEEADFGK